MLEYQKFILQKVSFDKELFRKELIKTLKWISKEEQKLFKNWVIDNFKKTYSSVISEVFQVKPALI